MSTPQETFIAMAAEAATAAAHPFPAMAACEAALESAWGTSTLAVKARNLFGQKAPAGWLDINTLALPTEEYLAGKMVRVMARWKFYQAIGDCFADRIATLRMLAPRYPEYQRALAAVTAEAFVIEVSRRWSTDPGRAAKALQIYHAHQAALQPYISRPSA